MLVLPTSSLSELFPPGSFYLYLARELPALQYASAAIFCCVALSALATYVNYARAQHSANKSMRANPEGRSAQIPALNVIAKSNSFRIRRLSGGLSIVAWLMWMIDVFSTVYLQWNSSSSGRSDSEDSDDLHGWALVLIITLAVVLGVFFIFITMLIIPVGQIYIMSWTLARYARRHGRESLDALLAGLRVGSAHMSLVWASAGFLCVSFLPTSVAVDENGSFYLLFAQTAAMSYFAWIDTANKLDAIEENVADVEFAKATLETGWVKRIIGKRSLAVRSFLPDDQPLPTTQTDLLDEKRPLVEL